MVLDSEAYRWALHIVTLLHDVPWKPWIVTGRLGWWSGLEDMVKRQGCRYAEIITASERNEREAQALIAWLACRLEENGAEKAASHLVEVVKREWENSIREADQIASSIDRILSPPIPPIMVKEVRLVNMFNPILIRKNELLGYATKIPDIIENLLRELITLVKWVVKSCGANPTCTLKRLYMALYTLLEVEWYRATCRVAGTPLSPVADTRIPHHTVFDHTRASVTALAMRNKTVYAIIDIPGVHNFISAARKTRDFWAGSWVLSAVAWGIVRGIVDDEGPHVVLLPAIQLNPFYLDMLVYELPGVSDKLPKITWDLLERWPSQPLMPATVSLILDGNRWSCGKLRDLVKEKLRDVWRRLWSILREELEKVKKEIEELTSLPGWCNPLKWGRLGLEGDRDALEAVKRLLCIYALSATDGDPEASKELLKVLIDYLIAATEESPLSVRVTCIEADYSSNDYKSFVDDIVGRLENVSVRTEKTVKELLEEIVYKASGKKLEARTILDRSLRLSYLLFRVREKLQETSNTSPSYTINVYDEARRLWVIAHSISRRAYRYCSLCGRLPAVARMPRLGETITTPWGSITVTREITFTGAPQTWTLQRLEGLIGYLADEGEALCPYCLLRRVLAKFPAVAQRLVHSARKAKKDKLASTLRVANMWIEDEIINRIAEELNLEEAKELYDVSPDRVLDVLRKLGKLPRHYRRVAVIYGDGDMMGSGYLRGVLLAAEAKWTQALQELAGLLGMLHDMTKQYKNITVSKNAVHKEDMIPPILYYYNLFSRAHRQVNPDVVISLAVLAAAVTSTLRSRGMLEEGDWPLTVIPTLSYMRTLSSGLMVTALVDASIVKALRGTLVYAGGDDVLAIVPPGTLDSSRLINSVVDSFREISSDQYSKQLESLMKNIVCSNTECADVSVALVALALTRLNYWGLLGDEPGFHVYEGVVAPAAAAHGRSYGVNFVHFRTPLWTSFNDAYRLMNMKDEVKVYLVNDVRGIRKDIAVIGFEGGGESVLPLSLDSLTDRLTGVVTGSIRERAIKGLKLGFEIYERIANCTYSMSLLLSLIHI